MADISSITLPGGGTYDLKDKNAVPKYGMGKNLLDNAYFVGGGSQLGDGVFPINQRGQSSYNANGRYTIDRWWLNSWHAQNIDVTIDAAGITLSQTATGANSLYLAQKISGWQQYAGKTVTVSILVMSLSMGSHAFLFGAVDGTRYLTSALGIGLNTFTVTLPNDITGLQVAFGHHASAGGSGAVTLTVSAAKLELGTEQTLAHQENGVWVLNEIPDYEEELIKCQTSTVDSSDTYANKTLATEQQIAYVESGTTASRAYAVGEYFCWNGLLYRAKTAIPNGSTFTPETNCEQTTVCDKQGYRLLWTNPNAGRSFSATTISGTSGFLRYHIVFRTTSSSQNYFDYVGSLDVGVYHAVTNLTSPTSGIPVVSFRTVVKEASGNLTISNCESRQVTASSRSQDNASMIPYKIYAIP